MTEWVQSVGGSVGVSYGGSAEGLMAVLLRLGENVTALDPKAARQLAHELLANADQAEAEQGAVIH